MRSHVHLLRAAPLLLTLVLAACDSGGSAQPSQPKAQPVPAKHAPLANVRYDIVDDPEEPSAHKLVIRIGDRTFDGPTGQYLTIEAVRDFNGDGVADALIASSTGGADCCEDNDHFVSVVDGKVMEAEIPDWSNGKVVENNGRPEVRYENDDKTEFYGFDGKKAVKLRGIAHRKLETIAQTPALTAFAEQESAGFDADVNVDGKSEHIRCDVWQRWGLYTACDLPLPGGGSQSMSLEPACNRVGVLKTTRNGMREFVCNNNAVIYFDGKAWRKKGP